MKPYLDLDKVNVFAKTNETPASTSTSEVATKKKQVDFTKEIDTLLSGLLEKINKVNFFELAGIKFVSKTDDNGNETGKYERTLQNRDYIVCGIDTVLDVASANNWNLCKNNETIYVYNGAFWQEIDKKDFAYFLLNCGLRLGIPKVIAKYTDFADKLLKQFLTIAHLPSPKPKENKTLINLQNGTFEITDKGTKLRDFDKNDFLTYQLPFEYNEKATCKLFDSYLAKVLPATELQNILSEFIGYVFTKHIKLEKALVLLGEGGNGKSVFYEIINALLGTTNISQYSMKSLTEQSNYYIAKMPNKLLNYCSEFKEIGDLDKAKKLISNEDVEARLPYCEPFTFRFSTKVMFNSNSLPKDNIEQNEAFFRRLLIIPFNVTITDNEKDVELPNKIIQNELAGVFLWVLKGLQRLLAAKKFTYSKLAENELNHYKNTSDTVSMFLSENGYKPTKEQTSKLLMDLFNEYRSYCLECNYKPLGKNNFSERLQKKHKFLIGKKEQGLCVYFEINL